MILTWESEDTLRFPEKMTDDNMSLLSIHSQEEVNS